MHSSYKYYFLLTKEKKNFFVRSFSLSHNKLSHFFSSLCFFSLFTPLLSPPLTFSLPTNFSLYLPLFSFFSLFLLSSITPFFNKFFFFFSPHKSVNSSLTIFGIYQTIWPMWHFELFKMEIMNVIVILNYEMYG